MRDEAEKNKKIQNKKCISAFYTHFDRRRFLFSSLQTLRLLIDEMLIVVVCYVVDSSLRENAPFINFRDHCKGIKKGENNLR